LQQGAAVYANKMHDLNPDNVEQPGVAPEAPLHGYDFIDDWAQQLDHKKPGGYVSHTEEIPAPRIAARPVTPEKPVTRGSKSYPEAPDLQRPVDHTNIDDSRVGIVAPSQDMLSQKLDRRYRSQHRNTSERRTLSFVRRVTGQLLGYAATAGYAVAANETYLHHIPFLQVH
jgi:hypothetical protein